MRQSKRKRTGKKQYLCWKILRLRIEENFEEESKTPVVVKYKKSHVDDTFVEKSVGYVDGVGVHLN